MTDQNNGAFFPRKLEGFEMDFGDQRAGGVNDFQLARPGFIADGGRHAVGAENQHGAVRDFFNGFHENGAAAAKLLDDVSVVNNFMVHIDRRAISFQSQFDDIHGADHAGAKAARPHAEQYLSITIVMVLHCHLVYCNPENSIIPQRLARGHAVSSILTSRLISL